MLSREKFWIFFVSVEFFRVRTEKLPIGAPAGGRPFSFFFGQEPKAIQNCRFAA